MRGMIVQYGDVVGVWEFSMNMVNNVFVDFVDVVLVVGYFGGKVYVVGFEDLYMFGSYFIWFLVQVVKLGFDQFVVYVLVLWVVGNDFCNFFVCYFCNVRVIFSHKDQYVFFVGKMGEVLGVIFSVI